MITLLVILLVYFAAFGWVLWKYSAPAADTTKTPTVRIDYTTKGTCSQRHASLTFDQLRRANALRGRTAFTTSQNWSYLEWGGALAGEVGEALNILKKVRRGDMQLKDARAALADELGDVQAYLDILARQCDIDLGEATRRKFNAVSKRVESEVKL